MSTNHTPAPSAPRHELYVPGFAAAKLGLALLGLVLLALAFYELGPLTKLAFTGSSARGEAVRIARTDAAGQAAIYVTDAEVQSAIKAIEESRDRESVFWIEYRFTTDKGPVEARSSLGQHVKPLHPLRDSDGLPSTIRLWYDRAAPERIALPLMFGTWFMPGMLVLFGTLAVFMGLTLWYHARKPIEMPDLSHAHGEQPSGK